MFRLAFLVSLALASGDACLAQQFPLLPGGELPVAAIELDKMPWTKIPGISAAQEFATIVGDRAKPGFYIQLVRWPPHSVLKAHSHPDDRYVMVLSGTFYHGIAEKFDEKQNGSAPGGQLLHRAKGCSSFRNDKG